MTREEFQQEMEALIELYPGQGKHNPWVRPRLEAFFEALRQKPFWALRKAIAKYSGTSFHPPKVQDLLPLIDEAMAGSHDEAKPLKVFSCGYCRGNGYVEAKERTPPHYTCWFRCGCENGPRFKARAQTWDFSRHMDQWELLPPIGGPGG